MAGQEYISNLSKQCIKALLVSTLSLFLLGINSAAADIEPCGRVIKGYDPSIFYAKSECYENGKVASFSTVIKSSNRVATLWQFDRAGHLLDYKTFNAEGEVVILQKYQFLKEPNIYAYEYPRKFGADSGRVVETVRVFLEPEFRTEKADATYYIGDIPLVTEYFAKGKVNAIDQYDPSGRLQYRYSLKIVPGKNPYSDQIESFVVSDGANKVIGTYKSSEMPVTNNKFDRVVVILDSGIDFSHPDLINKIASTQQHGLFPETMKHGWFFDTFSKRSSENIRDDLFFVAGRYPYVPFSHGTHVAGILIKNIVQFGLVSFGGDYSDENYLPKISDWLKRNSVRFVNMSFGFGDTNNPFGPNTTSRIELLKLMGTNTQTLFSVAAGNDTADLDQPEKDDIPPKAPIKNKVVVASLNTDKVEIDRLEDYRLATLSNYGLTTVDVAAAGEEVESTNIGGTYLKLSGTSMAAPSVMHTILRMSEVNPLLSNDGLKELLMCTAYKPRSYRLAVKAGIVVEARAVLAAQISKSNGDLQKVCQLATQQLPLGLE